MCALETPEEKRVPIHEFKRDKRSYSLICFECVYIRSHVCVYIHMYKQMWYASLSASKNSRWAYDIQKINIIKRPNRMFEERRSKKVS